MPLMIYLDRLLQLLVVPFDHFGRAWYIILPLYTSLILGELYKGKVGFGHAVGNGFVMLWTGLSWARDLAQRSFIHFKAWPWILTVGCIAIGVFTILLGIRKKDKALCQILGHTRFSGYVLLTFYPIVAGFIGWEWPTLVAILIWAIPSWILIYIIGRIATKWVG